MDRLKVIQIGGEHDHAAPVLDSLRRQSDIFELAGYVLQEDDPDGQYRQNKRWFDGVPRLGLEEALSLPGLGGAVIETSETNLTKYARVAAERGLAVHMDKPGGMDCDEFRAMAELVKQRDLAFSLGYMYRFNPAVQKLMAMRRAGELGEIVSVEAQMNCLHAPEKRDWLGKYPGGMMFFLGCHLIDLILTLQGDPLEIVPMNAKTGLDGASGEDFGLAMLRYQRGWSLAKTSAAELGGFMRRQLVVCGTKATVEINPLEYLIGGGNENQYTDMYVTRREDCEKKGWQARGERQVFGPVNRYDGMLRAFALAALGRGPKYVDMDYETKLHHAVMAASGQAEWPGARR